MSDDYNPYQYCTRCGDELPDYMKEKYAEEHRDGPIICLSCLKDIVQGLGEAINTIYDSLESEIGKIFENDGEEDDIPAYEGQEITKGKVLEEND